MYILALLCRVPALIGRGEECVHSVGRTVRHSNLQLPPLWLESIRIRGRMKMGGQRQVDRVGHSGKRATVLKAGVSVAVRFEGETQMKCRARSFVFTRARAPSSPVEGNAKGDPL